MFVGYNYRYWYRYTGPVFAWYRIPESAVSLGRWTQRVKRQTPPTPSRHRRPLAGVTSRFFPLNSESVRWFTQTQKDLPSQLPGKGVSLGFCGKFLKFYLLDAEERRKEGALRHCCALHTDQSGSELRDGGREGSAAVVPDPVWGLPGCLHHQHDHVLQGRTGFLRPHPQTQTRSHVSTPGTGPENESRK